MSTTHSKNLDRQHILGLRVADFIREYVLADSQNPLFDRLARIAARLGERPWGTFGWIRHEARVADLVEATDRPLVMVDPIKEIIGVWRGMGRAEIESIMGRLQMLGITPETNGFSTLGRFAKRTLIAKVKESHLATEPFVKSPPDEVAATHLKGVTGVTRDGIDKLLRESDLAGLREALKYDPKSGFGLSFEVWLKGGKAKRQRRALLTARARSLRSQLKKIEDELAEI